MIKKEEVHLWQTGKKPVLNDEYMEWDKEVPETNLMMCREIQELCKQLLDIVGHDIPITCNKRDVSYYYDNWYKKIAKKEKERHSDAR